MSGAAAALCVIAFGSAMAQGALQGALQGASEGEPGARTTLDGDFIQGGLVIGRTVPGATIKLDEIDAPVADDGRFVLGFDRDYGDEAVLTIVYPDGQEETRKFEIASREYNVQRIDGLPPAKVTPRTAEQRAQIEREWLQKRDARANIHRGSWFAEPFRWPATGPISGVFGSQRILNGEPRRPHYGLDIAAPAGAPVAAPAGGVVVLAETGMYFEGGLVMLDHGNGLVSALMHLSRVDVEEGRRVAAGDIIGAVGATGRATGPHLHWGLQWAGQNLDPQRLVPAAAE